MMDINLMMNFALIEENYYFSVASHFSSFRIYYRVIDSRVFGVMLFRTNLFCCRDSREAKKKARLLLLKYYDLQWHSNTVFHRKNSLLRRAIAGKAFRY